MNQMRCDVSLRAAMAAATLAALLAACEGDGGGIRSPTAPPIGPPTQPSALPVSATATPGTYTRTSPTKGPFESRLVFAADGAFRLEYSGGGTDPFSYLGTYARTGDWYLLDFQLGGPLPSQAFASFGGNCVEVEFNIAMLLSDFENGRFCR